MTKTYKGFSLKVWLTRAAVAGNILFVLWILYNGIHEHFEGKLIEKIAYITLMLLLSVNSFLLIRRSK